MEISELVKEYKKQYLVFFTEIKSMSDKCTVDHCDYIDAVQMANDLVMDYFWMGTINNNPQINKRVLKARNIGLVTADDLLKKKKKIEFQNLYFFLFLRRVYLGDKMVNKKN